MNLLKFSSSTVFVVFICLTLSLIVCGQKKKGKTKTSESQQEKAIVRLENSKIVVTSQDADQIRQALRDYLTNAKEEINQSSPVDLPPNLTAEIGEPALNSGGYWRISPWLLGGRGDELVLTYRVVPPTTRFGYQYVVSVARSENKWRASHFRYEKLYPRR